MNEPIYFSKIKYIGGRVGSNRKFRILLDLNRSQIECLVTEQKEVISDYKKELSVGLVNQILPLCEIYKFEQCLSDDENALVGWGGNKDSTGYRDEVSLIFYGFIDSDVPEMEIEISFLYDRQHEPPQEKLYQFLIQNFLLKDKDLK